MSDDPSAPDSGDNDGKRVPLDPPGSAAPAHWPGAAPPEPPLAPRAISSPVDAAASEPARSPPVAPRPAEDSTPGAFARDRSIERTRRRELRLQRKKHRRLRLRRHGRRAYIRSAYSLPSLATLGNAVCGFGAMYVATLTESGVGVDSWTGYFFQHQFVAASYLIFIAMLFDALDGRLARFTRHTTDFGGQLDSMADVISFGVAPAFLALHVFKTYQQQVYHWDLPPLLSRLVWAIGALYMSCAAIRLARFNVSNQHGEQHHFSFLGLPSPGAGGTVAALVLMQQDLVMEGAQWADHPRVAWLLEALATTAVWALPVVVAGTGLLMVSNIRYPHLVNRYLRGRRSLRRIVLALILVLALIVAHRYTLCLATLFYTLWALVGWAWRRAAGGVVIGREPSASAGP